MAATIVERPESRPGSGSPSKQHELIYKIKGASDDLDALAALYAQAPASYNSLAARQGKIEPMATPGYYLGRMEYKPASAASATPRPETGENITSFQIGGGSIHLVQAVAHIQHYAPAGIAGSGYDYGVLINVQPGQGDKADVVAGIDIPQLGGAQIVSLTRYIDDSDFTAAYRNTVSKLALHTNDDAFTIIGVGAYSQGEVLFLGLDASQRGDGSDWEAQFQFAVAENLADACSLWPAASKPSVAVPKKGWEYLWTRTKESVQTGPPKIMVPVIETITVQQVFYEADLTDLNP